MYITVYIPITKHFYISEIQKCAKGHLDGLFLYL